MMMFFFFRGAKLCVGKVRRHKVQRDMPLPEHIITREYYIIITWSLATKHHVISVRHLG